MARPSVELKAQSINEGMQSKDGPSPVTRNRNQLTKMPSHRDQNMKVLGTGIRICKCWLICMARTRV